MKKIIVAGGLIVAVGIAAPWAVGALTEQRWGQTEANLNSQQAMIQIETRNYDRGYSNASVEGVLRLQLPGAAQPIKLPWQGTVSHGLTGSEIDFEFSEGDSELVKKIFPDERPALSARINALGAVNLGLVVPAIALEDDASGNSVQISEVQARVDVLDGGEQLEVAMTWPGMVATDQEASFTLETVELNQSMTLLDGSVWVGEASLSLEHLVARLDDAPEAVFTNLVLDSETTAVDDDRRFTVDSRLDIEKLGAGDHASGPFLARFALEDVEIEAWNGLLNAASDLQMLNSTQVAGLSRQAMMEQQMQAMNAVNAGLKQLVTRGMSVGFPEINLDFEEGGFTGSAMFSHPQLEASDVTPQTLIMEQLTGDVNLRLPAALIEAQPSLEAQLAPLLQQGFLVQDGDDVTLDARLEDMAVTINETTIPLPPVM